jgi:hypothetical protein
MTVSTRESTMQSQSYNDLSTGQDSAGSTPTSLRDPSEKIDRATQAAHETVDRVSRRALDLTDRATTEGERMYQATCGWIAAHPVQAVVGALVAGYLYGRIRS